MMPPTTTTGRTPVARQDKRPDLGMKMMTSTADIHGAAALLQAGLLDEAIDAQLLRVRAHPADTMARHFLAELMVAAGELTRADRQLDMIAGAMALLQVGDPAWLATDVGPIIDEAALESLRAYCAGAERRFRVVGRAPAPDDGDAGLYLPPVAYEMPRLEDLDREVFGPVLHVVRWRAAELDALVDRINALGYGLTLSLHSRSRSRAERVMDRARVGNLYVNRNQIGAVVGVQPFGGEGLSGTGPKAGGPHYLERFAVERAVSIDTTAAGGNASLLTIDP